MAKLAAPPVSTAKILGDSITFQNNVATHFSDRGYFVWANAYLGQAFEFTGNYGVSGQRSDEILKRVGDVINVDKPSYCFVLAGVNDISQQATKNTTAAGTFANIRAIYDALTNAGVTVIALTLPASNSWTTDTQNAMYFELNRLIKDYARVSPNIILVDGGSAYLDPASLGPVTGMTVDGTHPAPGGASRMGRLLADELRKHIKLQPTTLAYSNIDPGNMLKNATFSGTGGTAANASITGDIAANWIGAAYSSATVVASKVNRSLRMGQRQRLTISGGTATGNAYLYQDVSTGFAAGDKVYGQIALEIDASSVVTKSIEFGVDCRSVTGGVGTSLGTYFGMFHESAAPDLNYTPTGQLILRTPTFTVPANTNQLRFSLRIHMSTGIVDVDVADLRKV
ncbi:SGNH/GDSL hydrolase family protein [Paenibacillus wulumuqiensis]|uniref:SGNH/GDSL hydrolase family protein n=1 Tax=Paenibacillus wulumuqiensis TaxID=1567107 RepID=UPI001F35D4BE|nr:GDSL-type esterase/lipase family protein [Paenibacillus wulumuqiensis]